MPAFQTEVPHHLPADEAKSRVDSLLASIEDQYPGVVSNLQSQWEANVLSIAFTAFGFNVKSNLTVEDQKVGVAGNIPLTAMPLKSKIQATITEKLSELLA